jgi:hypothetical protein
MDKSAIHETTLQARQILTSEIEEMLQGIFGLDSRLDFAKEEKIPALREMPKLLQTRRRLEKRLADEVGAGLSRADAVARLIKEAAFTHLNRLVALKMMERRSLIEGTLERYQDSRGFIFYLAEPEHAEDLRLYETGGPNPNPLGEGARDVAYRHFLLHQCRLLSREIRVLFDPDDLASLLFPRPRALKSMIEMLNSQVLADVWGEDETIGWIYQYFTEPDLDIFKGRNAPKVPANLLAPRTQLFTHRWVVKFLVQNSLGRLWIQMHPDSRLKEKMNYLVPSSNEHSAQMKLVRDISVLDPACGTMHFGLVAFDLLADMYQEELERAGLPGWNQNPSIRNIEEIPAAILAYNLHGIDIDLRAVQISALSLYLKAKKFNPKTNIIESNLACADVLLLNGTRLEDFLKKMRFTYPVYERVIRTVWSELREAGQFGSLLRLEKEIEDLVAKEKADRRPEISLSSYLERPVEAKDVETEFWYILDKQIIQAFDEFARQQSQMGVDSGFFAGEAVKGFKLLDVMMRRYDVIVTNPPYLDSRDYNSVLKSFLESEYPDSKRNLYSAFVDRCLELLSDGGRLGIITGQSFMFISSFETLRKNCLQTSAVECLAQYDYGLFESRVDTAAYVLRREPDASRRAAAQGTYFRLARELDSESKRLRFEQALAHLSAGEEDPSVFSYHQADFDTIPGSPWVYWITPGLRRLFVELDKLGEIAQPRVGLQTGDNFRFLRFWWEVGDDKVGFGCKSGEDAQASGKKWFPYMKGGGFKRWYGNHEFTVNWDANGFEIKNLDIESGRVASRPQNTDFYFRTGVTWTDLTSARFSARLSPGGFIFDVAGSSVFPPDIPLFLGIMNSTFSQFALNIINPTVHVQVGDLARLPIPNQSSKQLENLVERAISLAMQNSSEDETTFDFIAPPWSCSLNDTLTELFLQDDALKDVERDIDEEVYRLYAISDEDRKAIESELADPKALLDSNSNSDSNNDYIDDEELARRWISYCVGIVMGRFQPGTGDLGQGRFSQPVAAELRSLTDSDGVATLMEGHQDDLAAKVWQALQIALGEQGATEVVEAALGYDNPEEMLRRYLERDFFKRHLQQYRKRPVYWLLQSANKAFSVYIFHERATKDTLPLILGNRYVGGMINHLHSRLAELEEALKTAQGRDKKELAKEEAERVLDLQDLQRFEAALRRVLERKNERGETAGWTLEIDDGVILNLAPLAELMPAYKEPEKFWKALQEGEYDWSRTAMRYWPERVLEKCRKNKSFAIAHGRMDVYQR